MEGCGSQTRISAPGARGRCWLSQRRKAMRRLNSFLPAGLVLATGWIVASVGCQQMPSAARPQSASSLPFDNDPAKPLKAEQMADVQLALARSLERQGEYDRAIATY